MTQETFIRFFSSLSVYHHKGKTKNYLYIIANNLCIDYLKKIKEIPTEEKELSKKIEIGEQRQDPVLNGLAIESALKKLPDELQEVIILYYFNELEIKEIAETLQITVHSIYVRNCRDWSC